MITDLPTAAEFEDTAVAVLNLSWDYAAHLLRDLHEAGHHDADDAENYWSVANRHLATALMLTHQGAEFLLKSRIAAVSPYLLISSSPRDWPKGSSKGDTAFADFRTIDAQDLVNVHDTCCVPRLGADFIADLERLRRKRNSITHTFDRRLEVGVEEVLTGVLTVYSALCPKDHWVQARARYLMDEPIAILHSNDHVNGQTVWEFALVTEVLKPAAMKRFFGFDKRARRYTCLSCLTAASASSIDLTPLSATLSEDGTKTHCFVCGEDEKVERVRCTQPSCKGDLAGPDSVCMTCAR